MEELALLRERIEAAFRRAKVADYAEVRVELFEHESLSYRGRTLEQIGRTTGCVGNVRVLCSGGWGFVSFNDVEHLEQHMDQALEQARLVGGEAIRLAPVEPVVDRIPLVWKKNPLAIPLEETKRLFDHYNDLLWGAAPHMQTTVLRYRAGRRQMLFANSEGSFIEQERGDVTAVFAAVARDGGTIEQAHLSIGSPDDYGIVEGLDEQVIEVAQRAEALLSARPVKGGTYTVVVDPQLAGVFVHEAFGHLSESDFVYENERLQEIMVLGRRFGPPILNVVDGAAVPGLRGSYRYDDEGTPAHKTYLIREGILTGRLHSRETAGKMGEPPTGNARAISYRYPPIVRMTNTYIEAGESSFEDLLSGIDEGLYVKGSYGGETAMEMFTFTAEEAFMIRKGRIEERVRGVTLSGNVFETLANIEAIGNDLQFFQGGGCGKGEQSPLPVSDGGPHLRIRQVVVGGEA